MKKFILLICIFFCYYYCNGQLGYPAPFKQGSWLLAGYFSAGFGTFNLDYDNLYYESYKTSSFNGEFAASIFASNGFSLGTTFDYNSNEIKGSEYLLGENSIKSYSIGPLFRYYVPEWPLFMHFSLSFGKTFGEDDPMGKSKVKKIRLGMGYAFFTKKAFAIEVSAMWGKTTYRIDEYGSFRQSEFVMAIGINKFLSKKKTK